MSPPEPPRPRGYNGRGSHPIVEVDATTAPHTPIPPPPDRRGPPREFLAARPFTGEPRSRPSSPGEDNPPLERRRALTPVRDSGEIRVDTLLENLYSEGQARRAAEEELQALKANRVVMAPVPTAIEVDKATTAHVVLAGKRWRVGVPIALLSPVVLWAWTAVQNYIELERQVKSLNLAVGSYEGRMAAHEQMASDLKGDIATLRETQAKLSGYLAGALPLAGVSVPGAETGSIQVTIDRDPDKAGTKRRVPVVTHTRVPAPPPK